MKKILLLPVLLLFGLPAFCWGFYAHRLINQLAVFLLPPEMIVLYKPHIGFLSGHAVDPDKRRYVMTGEASRHFIDIDRYGQYPYPALPRSWKEAADRFTEDTLAAYGIIPWWIPIVQRRLTAAFRNRDLPRILKLSADLGHYIGDAHVPLHASSNHNGQLTNQHGIHGFWESRVPELLAETSWDFFIGPAQYVPDPAAYIWNRILESAAAADSALFCERKLNASFTQDRKYAYEIRNGVAVKQYSKAYTIQYDKLLNSMIERRMQQAVYSTASFWYTAWVDAGQPDLSILAGREFAAADSAEFDQLNASWKAGSWMGKSCD